MLQIMVSVNEQGIMSISIPPNIPLPTAIGILELAKANLIVDSQKPRSVPPIIPASANALDNLNNRINGRG